MKTRLYLIFLILVIMGAGARTMFQVAHNGAAREHEFGPDNETLFLILLAIWFMVMMVGDVLLLRNKRLAYRNILIALLSLGIFAPLIYMYLTHK